MNFNEWFKLKEASDSIENQIRNAYYQISGGRKDRVRLADLRNTLRSVPRQELDHALLNMARSGQIALFQFDNPMEKTPADTEAALVLPTGNVRHVMYMA